MFKYRGIIEGFYGRPWSHVERLMMLKWMGDRGYTHYMYAPKADSYHRANWRKPYPEEEVVKLKELIDEGAKFGVSFGFAVSPGLSMRYTSETDRQALYKKFEKFVELGVKTLGLFFDDIPLEMHHVEDQENYRTLAEAQADVVNQLYERLLKLNSEVELIFCPTVYCGNGKDDYLDDLGFRLNPAIEIFWTGPQVCSRTITRADMEAVTKALRRKPLLWDNYPVNDGSMSPELHIGPFPGRDAELPEVVGGFFINPMNQVNASLVPLHAISIYLHNPANYQVDHAWEEAIFMEIGKELADEYEHFAEYNQVSPIHTPEMNRYYELWKLQTDASLMETEAHAMEATAVRLLEGLRENPLGVEIKPWVKDFIFWSKVGLRAARVQLALKDLFNINPGSMEAVKLFIRVQFQMNRLRRLLRKCPEVRTAVTGGLIHDYALRVYRSVENLMRTYVDKRGVHFRGLRWVMRRF